MSYPAISVDLPWSLRTSARTVVAGWSGSDIHLVTSELDGKGLERWITEHAAPDALIVLDVPIDGCDDLCREQPWRALDSGLAGIGIPILPSYKSGKRGPDLRQTLLNARPDLQVLESYPYAVLRVLWGVAQETRGRPDLGAASNREYVTRWDSWWKSWPPRYKRARRVSQRREAVAAVAKLLQACGDEYAVCVRAPSSTATTTELARLSDEYDALLGLFAARMVLEESPWSWRAEVTGLPGSIVMIGTPAYSGPS